MKDSRLSVRFVPLLALAALGGCAGANSGPTPPLQCPQTAVLQQAQTMTMFLPGHEGDVGAKLTTAQITGVAGSCTLEKAKHAVLVKVQAGFAASNGPANQGKPLTLPFFAAIVRGDKIIDKQTYNITLKFKGNESQAQAISRDVKIELPNIPASADSQILIGFQMTQSQLAYAQTHTAP